MQKYQIIIHNLLSCIEHCLLIITMKEEPEQIKPSDEASPPPRDWKKIIISAFIVALALVCFSLSIFAMSSAVVYFSFMFQITDELVAKAYLKLYYSWFMAITYMSIFGLVIVLADTIVYFTKFTQKERLVWLHAAFYLAMLVCGIVALAGGADYKSRMDNFLLSSCITGNFECLLAVNFDIFRDQVTSYFIGYCICFLAYGILYHYSAYTEKRQREKSLNKLNTNETQVLDNASNKDNIQNISNISIEE